eukprot:scaffold55343_cov37-Tisochrysis_lutea.AAC.6
MTISIRQSQIWLWRQGAPQHEYEGPSWNSGSLRQCGGCCCCCFMAAGAASSGRGVCPLALALEA